MAVGVCSAGTSGLPTGLGLAEATRKAAGAAACGIAKLPSGSATIAANAAMAAATQSIPTSSLMDARRWTTTTATAGACSARVTASEPAICRGLDGKDVAGPC